MAVDDGIDYTPPFTFSTLQFDNETINLVVTSLIAVLILANIGSIISKIVYFTRETKFSYDSWLRAFIFANSDNPIRILAWIFRGYVYRDKKWKRNSNKLRPGRLFIPLLARMIILLFSIASVAITIPSEKRIKGCNAVDYVLTFDQTKATLSDVPNSLCLNIPLTSNRGSVLASAAYCTCPISEDSLDIEGSGVAVFRDEKQGRLRTIVYSQGKAHGTASYVEWKRTEDEKDKKGRVYRTDVSPQGSKLDQASHAEIAIRAISASHEGCNRGEPRSSSNRETGTYGYRVPLECDFDTAKESEVVSSHLKNALSWVRTDDDELQRLVLEDTVTKNGTASRVCPIEVSVQRPIVNIAPLILVLGGIFLVNIFVSIFVSKHSNALDAGFHIIKEALGHDCTSNPLEQSIDREELKEVQLRKWHCNGGGAYVGFFGRHCDRAVNKFGNDATVCSCTNVTKGYTDSVRGVGTEGANASDTSNSYGAFSGASGYTGGAHNNYFNQA